MKNLKTLFLFACVSMLTFSCTNQESLIEYVPVVETITKIVTVEAETATPETQTVG